MDRVTTPHREYAALAAELELDRVEMAGLLAGCRSSRVFADLLPWLSKTEADFHRMTSNSSPLLTMPTPELFADTGPHIDGACATQCDGSSIWEASRKELQADRTEMRKLVEVCSSWRVKREMQLSLDRIESQIQHLSFHSQAAGPSRDYANDFAESQTIERNIRSDSATLHPDLDEMLTLVRTCKRARIHQELRPWLLQAIGHVKLRGNGDSQGQRVWINGAEDVAENRFLDRGCLVDHAEPQADLDEMATLTQACKRARVSHEVRPWELDVMSRLRNLEKRCHSLGPHICKGKGGDSKLPIVVIAGVPGLGKRRLLRALTDGAPETSYPGAQLAVDVTNQTQYHTTWVRPCVVDVNSDELDDKAVDKKDEVLSLFRMAAGIILLWDIARPETLTYCFKLYDEAVLVHCGRDRSEDANVGGTLRLCVAVAGCHGGALDSLDLIDSVAVEEEARAQCVQRDFETLRCSLDGEDLDTIRDVRQQCREGLPSLSRKGRCGAERIAEAMHSFVWPNSEIKPAPRNESSTGAGFIEAAPAEFPPSMAVGSHASGMRPKEASASNSIEAAPLEASSPPQDVADACTTARDKQPTHVDPTASCERPAATSKTVVEDIDRMEYQFLGPLAKELHRVRELPDSSRRRECAEELALQITQVLRCREESDEDDDGVA